jgi:hypothetical protein
MWLGCEKISLERKDLLIHPLGELSIKLILDFREMVCE